MPLFGPRRSARSDNNSQRIDDDDDERKYPFSIVRDFVGKQIAAFVIVVLLSMFFLPTETTFRYPQYQAQLYWMLIGVAGISVFYALQVPITLAYLFTVYDERLERLRTHS